MTNTEQAVEASLETNFSLALLCRARPDIKDLLQQAYRAGFADGALWQAVQIRDLTEEILEAV